MQKFKDENHNGITLKLEKKKKLMDIVDKEITIQSEKYILKYKNKLEA